MPSPARDILRNVFDELSDWLFLFSGLTLLALALLTPQWLACQDLAWQRDLMRIQVERLDEQQRRYHAFYQALKDDDPILLERLAFTQLGWKPAGKQVLNLREAIAAAAGLRGGNYDLAEVIATSASVDQWLLEPMPRLGVDAPIPNPVNSRLTRLTTQPTLRIGLLAAAVACIAAGLWPTSEKKPASEPVRAPRYRVAS